MKKFLFCALVAFVASTTHGQEVDRELKISMEGNSGNLNSKNGAIVGGRTSPFNNDNTGFDDQHLKMTVQYEQNFAKAQWLKAYAAVDMRGDYGPKSTADGAWISSDPITFTTFRNSIRGTAGVNLGDIFDVAILGSGQGMRLDFDLYYRGTFAQRHEVLVGTALSIDPLKSGLSTINIINNLELYIGYGVNFAPNWVFNTEVSFYTSGASTFNQDVLVPVFMPSDSAKALGYNLAMNWDNKIGYYGKSFDVWGSVRYTLDNMAKDPARIASYVSLHAGIAYKFNFEKGAN